jgi:Cu/Ag efflux protein CusF
MRKSKGLWAGLTAGSLLWAGTAFAQATPPPATPGTPDRVEGQVVKIDQNTKKVTVQGAGGQVFEFQASDDTLKSLKVGDRIEAKLRPK